MFGSYNGAAGGERKRKRLKSKSDQLQKKTAIAKSVPGLLHMWHSSCLTQSLCMDFAGWGAESLPSVPPRSPNAGVISPEPTRACLMNLQGCYPSLKAVCVCACVCVRFCLWNSLFRQIAAFLKKPQVKCFKWTLSSEGAPCCTWLQVIIAENKSLCTKWSTRIL